MTYRLSNPGIWLYINSTSYTLGATGEYPIPNQWNQILVTIDRDGYANIYRDGVYKNHVDVSAKSSTNMSTDVLYIGGLDGTADSLKGSIDEVRIYNSIIPTSQIRENYLAGLNKLLANNTITQTEYNQRVVSLNKNIAKK